MQRNEWKIKGRLLKDKLQEYCNEKEFNFKIVEWPYWTAEIYGFGKQISKYGYYPYILPLCVYTDHGPGYYDELPKHELETNAPYILYHSKKSVELWSDLNSKKAHCMLSPFVFYRKKQKIERKQDAKGTIVFPAHSTPSIDDISGYNKYIDDLKKLGVEYLPIKICMHMHDINKGLHKKFTDAGFEVVTAGNTSSQNYIEKFYQIIVDFKYATSNIPGSYLYYCVDIGIPFFIYGEKPIYLNISDPNLSMGLYDPWGRGYGLEAYRMFNVDDTDGYKPRISHRQLVFVNEHLGVESGISRTKMCVILYTALFKFMLTRYGFIFLIRKNIFATWYVRLRSLIYGNGKWW